jgi:predicted MFS family arabinose efflux permease
MAILTERIQNQSDCNIKKKYRRNVYIMYGATFLNYLQFLTPVMVPFFSFYVSFSEFMILQSVFMVSTILSEIPLGAIADYLTRKFSINLAFMVSLFAIPFFLIRPGFWMFFCGEILWGFAGSFLSGADKALLYSSLVKLGETEKSPTVLRRLFSCKLLGFLISAPLGGLIAMKLGTQNTLFFMLIGVGLAYILSFFLYEPKFANKEIKKSYLQIIRTGFGIIQRDKNLSRLILTSLVVTSLCAHITHSYQQKLIILNTKQVHFGWIFSIYLIGQILFLNLHKHIIKKFNRKTKFFMIWSLLAASGMFILMVNAIAFVILGLFLVTSFGMTYSAIMSSNYHQSIPREYQSTVSSTINMIYLFSLAIINPLGGMLIEYDINLIFGISCFLLVVWSVFNPIKEKNLEVCS